MFQCQWIYMHRSIKACIWFNEWLTDATKGGITGPAYNFAATDRTAFYTPDESRSYYGMARAQFMLLIVKIVRFRKTTSQLIKYAHIYQITDFCSMVIPDAICQAWTFELGSVGALNTLNNINPGFCDDRKILPTIGRVFCLCSLERHRLRDE